MGHLRTVCVLFHGIVAGVVSCGNGTLTSEGDTGRPLTSDEALLSPKALLGKRLFEDQRLSEPPGQSCASCHEADKGFTGNNGSAIAAVAAGSRSGVLGQRNAPTALYASFSPPFEVAHVPDEKGNTEPVPIGGQFWDGRASGLAAQALGPFLNAREMNNPDKVALITKIENGPYASLFRAVYGESGIDDVEQSFAGVGDAIAAFEESPRFHPFSSKFDRALRGEAQLDPLEARGFALFKDPRKGNCLACHAGDADSRNPLDWLFTDFTYDNLGLPRNPAIPDNADPEFFDLGLCQQEELAARAPEQVEGWCGAFKVPSLRNVEITAPYGHNGVFPELRDVVRFYVTRDTHPELWYPTDGAGVVQVFNDLPASYHANVNTTEVPYDRKPGEEPRLNEDEIDAIVAFLKTLTDQ